MKPWLILSGAIVLEVFGTLSLRAAVDKPIWIVFVLVSYILAFWLLGLTLRSGMSIGAAYGVWAAAGVALVALFGVMVFGENLSQKAVLGIVLIIAGVFAIESDSTSRGNTSQTKASI